MCGHTSGRQADTMEQTKHLVSGPQHSHSYRTENIKYCMSQLGGVKLLADDTHTHTPHMTRRAFGLTKIYQHRFKMN